MDLKYKKQNIWKIMDTVFVYIRYTPQVCRVLHESSWHCYIYMYIRTPTVTEIKFQKL